MSKRRWGSLDVMSQRPTAPFYIVAAALFVLLVASNMPTPLNAVYRERFGFSSAVQALIFATYAVVLVPSLLLFGQLSDRLGRRRVIAVGLGVAMLETVTASAPRCSRCSRRRADARSGR